MPKITVDYYLVTPGGQTARSINDLVAKAEKSRQDQMALAKEFGADEWGVSTTEVLGFYLKPSAKVDPNMFRRLIKDPANFYRPNSKTKEGKALLKRCRDISIYDARDMTQAVGGRSVPVECVGVRQRLKAFSYESIEGHIILTVPRTFKGEPGWKNPPVDVESLKASQYWLLKEEQEAAKKAADDTALAKNLAKASVPKNTKTSKKK